MATKKLARVRSIYRCEACGHVEVKWLGRCPACQEWSSLVEEVAAIPAGRQLSRGAADGSGPVPILEVVEISAADRLGSGIAELDRVLGGGLVAGCLVLLGGDPGVGKSTLLVQALAGLARGRGGAGVLYATGEESVAQTAMRARRGRDGGGPESVGTPARRAAGRCTGLGGRRVGGWRAPAPRRDPGAGRAGERRVRAADRGGRRRESRVAPARGPRAARGV